VLLTDVVVVGGGPAGAAAAVTLARSGRQVVLVDRATFPRDKFCGDGLTTAALRLLHALGLDPAQVATWFPVEDVHLVGPDGRGAVFPLPRDQGLYAAVAKRVDLDAAVLDLARAAGVKVLDGHACTGASAHDDRVIVEVEGVGEVHARYGVAADGMWSPVRRFVGADTPGYRGEWHAFRQYFSGVTTAASRDLWIWFEADLLPGYLWSFPLPDGRVNVGFGIQRGGSVRTREMARLWPELLERPGIREVLGPDAAPEAPHRAWPIPAAIDRAQLVSGRFLFVGDAAMATDPMTGEGIGQALATGVRAAEAIEAGGPYRYMTVGRDYESKVRSDLEADHRMSALLVRALAHPLGVRASLRAAGANDWTRRNFARWLFEDYPRASAVTPRRWQPGRFTGPGVRFGEPVEVAG
jgi:geranylgeranyl reductase family protein